MKYVQCLGRHIRFLLVGVGLLQTITINAAVLYESAGGMSVFTTSYENDHGRQGWLVRDYRPDWKDTTQFPAMPFMLSDGGEVTGFELALTTAADWSDNYSAQILSDNSGLPASSLWGASSLDAAPVFQTFANYSFTTVSGDPILLEGNTQYWLYLTCSAPCELTWWTDFANPAPGAIQYNNVYPYDLRWALTDMNSAMFRVIGDVIGIPEQGSIKPISEPAPIFLIAFGFAVLAIRRVKFI